MKKFILARYILHKSTMYWIHTQQLFWYHWFYYFKSCLIQGHYFTFRNKLGLVQKITQKSTFLLFRNYIPETKKYVYLIDNAVLIMMKRPRLYVIFPNTEEWHQLWQLLLGGMIMYYFRLPNPFLKKTFKFTTLSLFCVTDTPPIFSRAVVNSIAL